MTSPLSAAEKALDEAMAQERHEAQIEHDRLEEVAGPGR
jgi:hypothetical protein